LPIANRAGIAAKDVTDPAPAIRADRDQIAIRFDVQRRQRRVEGIQRAGRVRRDVEPRLPRRWIRVTQLEKRQCDARGFLGGVGDPHRCRERVAARVARAADDWKHEIASGVTGQQRLRTQHRDNGELHGLIFQT
jgi:hypothetical protein